ncbi:type III-B CRISPR-associated protein Cas10/Cmr2 [Actinocorallia sp. API 0066]|uniref:Cas10/Cmr2 second palm domain-containing protein n=1 Tax=Actinocorallia sp. API 0066 TaxID=2896846 RepID=UPI001E65CCB9|nr:type III-B CRISPR-associated protein Cas10/Cmr2 [Actinocorallia sp. API 0066]MCD0448601.1 type III-B CRISPR-associated protein Cas10/Cmr2 [Actinocorallia sp. API 0066]
MGAGDGDLVVLALGGVQRFISESRTTADLAAASAIMARLARAAAESLGEVDGVSLVFPESGESRGAPNRVVALVPAGRGDALGEAAAGAVRTAWEQTVQGVFKDAAAAGTPGVPDVTWVAVPAAAGDYATRWELAQRALAGRRMVRDFAPADELARPLCSLSPRWAAAERPPPGARRHHRQELLSRANWVKREWSRSEDGQGTRFPSTSSIASARFRDAVIRRLDDRELAGAVGALRAVVGRLSSGREEAVRGLSHAGGELGRWLRESAGGWVYPDRWTERSVLAESARPEDVRDAAGIASQGRKAAAAVVRRMDEFGVASPAVYLAVIAQDLDWMGRYLSGTGTARDGSRIEVSAASHQAVSRRLLVLGEEQLTRLSEPRLLGVPVYAGGDDLLAFAPAANALDVAAAAYGLVPADLPKASTAVLFFHQHFSLREAVTRVQEMLKDAKRNVEGKHALAVGVVRRSGTRAESIQPWPSARPDELSVRAFDLLGRSGEHVVSPRLVADLERDEEELASLPERLYTAELARLLARHTSGPADGRAGFVADATRALVDLGARERSVPGPETARPVPVARIGVFLRQEAR